MPRGVPLTAKTALLFLTTPGRQLTSCEVLIRVISILKTFLKCRLKYIFALTKQSDYWILNFNVKLTTGSERVDNCFEPLSKQVQTAPLSSLS